MSKRLASIPMLDSWEEVLLIVADLISIHKITIILDIKEEIFINTDPTQEVDIEEEDIQGKEVSVIILHITTLHHSTSRINLHLTPIFHTKIFINNAS